MSSSAFKTLYTQMIQNGGNYSALPQALLKKDLQVFVKETSPYFLVSDSFFYVPAYFTQAAINEYNSKFPNVKVMDLDKKVIVITKWSLELVKVNSSEVFTSYAGVECRLIVHSFKPQLKESLHPTRYPTNLYRDDEFKTTIQAFRHQQVVAAASKSKVDMAPISGGGNVTQGVLKNSCGEWKFTEGNTKVVALSAGKKKASGSAAAKVVSKKAAVKKVAKAGKKVSAVDALETAGTKAGKSSKAGKKSASKRPAATPEGGKGTQGSTSGMTVKQYQNWLEKVKSKKARK